MSTVETISRRLEPKFWRTTQREDGQDYEQRATAGKWGAILTALIAYQNKHRGMSPTDLMLAKDTRLSVGQVQYHLREMEKAGLIKDNRGWPRIITVADAAKVRDLSAMDTIAPKVPEKVEEARTMDTTKIRRHTKKLDFYSRAKQAAQAIMDHYDETGHAPGIRDLSYRVGFAGENGKATGAMSTLIARMVDNGWVYHEKRRHNDIALTGLGRAALFGSVDQPMQTSIPVSKAPPQPLHMTLRRDTSAAESASPTNVDDRVFRERPQPTKPVEGDDLVMELLREQLKGRDDTLSAVTTLDLVLELKDRGYKVSR